MVDSFISHLSTGGNNTFEPSLDQSKLSLLIGNSINNQYHITTGSFGIIVDNGGSNDTNCITAEAIRLHSKSTLIVDVDGSLVIYDSLTHTGFIAINYHMPGHKINTITTADGTFSTDNLQVALTKGDYSNYHGNLSYHDANAMLALFAPKLPDIGTLLNAAFPSLGYYYKTSTSNNIPQLGTSYADTLTEVNGHNMVAGLAGNDTITSKVGHDVIYGNQGNDIIHGGLHDTLYGGQGNDTVIAQGGGNFLYGNEGNDILNADSGNNTFTGGIGADTFIIGTGDNIITDFQHGRDVLHLDAYGLRSITSVITSHGSTTIKLSDGSTVLLEGVTQISSYDVGGVAIPVATFTIASNIVPNHTPPPKYYDYSIPIINLNEQITGDHQTLIGGAGNDTLTIINGSSDSISGGGGNDHIAILGISTDDTLTGGSGENSYDISATGHNHITDFRPGIDNITLSNITALSEIDGNAVITYDVIDTHSKGNTLILDNIDATKLATTVAHDFPGQSLPPVLFMQTHASNKTLIGGTGNDTLLAIGGSYDSLVGSSSGNNNLSTDSNSSNNTLIGGAGDDTITISNSSSDSISGGDGNNHIIISGTSTDNTLTGSGSNSYDISATGHNHITDFHPGIDTITLPNITALSEIDGNAVITYDTDGTLILDNIDATKLTITAAHDFPGQSLPPVLFMQTHASNETLIGGTGNDTLSAIGGSYDSLVGSSNGNSKLSTDSNSSNNTLIGGNGDDTITISNSSSDSISGGDGNNHMVISGTSTDNTLTGSGSNSYDISATGHNHIANFHPGIDTITLPNITALSEIDDNAVITYDTDSTLILDNIDATKLTITAAHDFPGQSLPPVLFMQTHASNETLIGGTGNDTLSAIGGSYDSLVGSSNGNSKLSTDSNSSNNTLIGGNGDDTITISNSSSDSISGGDGNNHMVISGTSTDNTLTGSGSNSYDISATGHNHITDFHPGIDTITLPNITALSEIDGNAVITYDTDSTLILDNIDATKLATTAAHDFPGQSLPPVLFMQTHANNETLIGGTGNDTLLAIGGSHDSLVGSSSGNNNLSTDGNSSNDTLISGDGDDTLTVIGTGNILTGGSGSDLFVISGTGTNTITDFEPDTDALSLSHEITLQNTVNGNTVMILDDGSVVILDNVDSTSLPDVPPILLDSSNNIYDNSNGATLTAAPGNNVLSNGNSPGVHGDHFIGGDGNDTISASGLLNSISGGAGNDVITIQNSPGYNTISGGSGNNVFNIISGNANTITDFKSGQDVLLLHSPVQSIAGNQGNSVTINMTDGNIVTLLNVSVTDFLANITHDLPGMDIPNQQTISANNTVYTGISGRNIITVSGSNNTVTGNSGSDTITTTGNNNNLFGSDGNDFIYIQNSTGNTLAGGSGHDTFTLSHSGHNTITDFTIGSDILTFSSTITSRTNNSDHNAVITTSQGDVVTLIGIDAHSLHNSDVGGSSLPAVT